MGLFSRKDAGVTAAATGARQRGRLQSCAFVLGVFLLPGLVILGGVASAIYGRVLQRELDALEASIRAKGEPVTREELDAYLKQTLESSPKAQKYMEPLELLEVIPEEDPMERFFPHSIQNYVNRGSFPDHELHSACEYLAVRRHVLDALKDAGEVTPGLGAEADWNAISSHELRQFEELVWTKGFMALHDLDWESFFDAQEQLLDFAEAFASRDYPTPALRHAVDLLRNAIRTGEVPAEFYGRIATPYSRIDNQESLRWRVICDRVIMVDFIRRHYAGEWLESELVSNVPFPLRTWTYRRIGRIPGYRSLEQFDTILRGRFYSDVLDSHGKPWRERYLKAIARQPFVGQYASAMDEGKTLPLPTRVINMIGSFLYPQHSHSQWNRRNVGADGVIDLDPISINDAYDFFTQPELRANGDDLFEVRDPTEGFIKIEFGLRSVRLAMLIDAYRQQTGTFPDSLDVLDPVEVAAIGGDPYVDGPLGYRVVEDGFLVYSVGPNLKDDGGEYLGLGKGDLVEQFVKEKPVEFFDGTKGRRGHDVQPTGPS